MKTKDAVIGAFWGGMAVGLILSIFIEWAERVLL